jgi:phosphatidylglycerophosphate synthase
MRKAGPGRLTGGGIASSAVEPNRLQISQDRSGSDMNMSTSAAAAHLRINDGVLAGLERRALVWIARRVPRVLNSDHFSALALASMAAAGLSFAAWPFTPWAPAGVVLSLAANWLGDSLDGTLARVRHDERPRYGYYVDHVIDLAGATLLLAGLACSGLIHPLIAVTVLCGYLLVASESYLATHASGVFRISFFGLGPTELRILLAAGVMKAMDSPRVTIGGVDLRLFDLGGVGAVIGLAIAFAVSALRNARALYAQEPLRRDAPPDRSA